ncbi:MAG: tetratricopeptide repeat protein, partial [Methanimicrococcus sp.]|nr:tetratricopeptide repeat protein [Methanimicrococcus sp.]
MTNEMIEQCENLHENGEHQKIIQLILGIPEKERNYQLTGILARAYNNENQYEEAVRLLLSVQKEGQYDILWHFRLGYAYYYLGKFEESKKEFECVLESDPEDEEAQMFLKCCISELENSGPYVSFKERVGNFWEWFTQNEEYLSDIITNRDKHDTNEVVVFISQGVQLISNDIHFNIGGNHELTFSVSGRYYLFYLLPYLTSRLPEQFQNKWKVFPYLPGTSGEKFGFGMFGQTIGTDEVMVKADYDLENDSFGLSFYNKLLSELDENECYNAFCIMMDITIGEGLAHIYINNVKKADSLEDGMIPLIELEAFIKESVSKAGKEILLHPDERYGSYKFQPQENEELRY